MKLLKSFLVLFMITSTASAHELMQLNALEKRVAALEEQISSLETTTAPVVEKIGKEERITGQRVKAKQRMRQDRNIYSEEQLREIEGLYQVANKQWRSKEGKDSLKQLVEKYDKANRTGCALQYLGQMSKGREREDYLLQAIEGYSDCYYGDGVQVGAYARFYLAYHYKESGKNQKSKHLFEELARDYPDAINHKGRLLEDIIGNE